ncbi:uncharacterized protein FFFS_15775 [Fusarium fujikuroi]|nr:uncharacterized protein FFFS_15775 [Fusarium fujikuroi]
MHYDITLPLANGPVLESRKRGRDESDEQVGRQVTDRSPKEMRSDIGENDDISISIQNTPVSQRPHYEENEENTQSSQSSDVLAVDQSQSLETTVCLTSTTVTEPQVAECNYVENPELKQISVHHFANGLKIDVQVFEFQAVDQDQVVVVEKRESTWEEIKTSAIALYGCDPRTFLAYVTECSLHAVSTQPQNESLLLVCPYGKSDLTDKALLLLGATQLLIMGWRVEGSPASRVLQNQLDCRLEHLPVTLERYILKSIDEQMRASDADKETMQLALYIMLLVIEKDLWRLMHWLLYPNELSRWRHPMRPEMLMKKALFLSDAVVRRLHELGPMDERFPTLRPSGELIH